MIVPSKLGLWSCFQHLLAVLSFNSIDNEISSKWRDESLNCGNSLLVDLASLHATLEPPTIRNMVYPAFISVKETSWIELRQRYPANILDNEISSKWIYGPNDESLILR